MYRWSISPQFSPAHGCGSVSTRIYSAQLGQRARRTVKYACALCPSRAARLSSRRSLVSPGICAPSLRDLVSNVGLGISFVAVSIEASDARKMIEGASTVRSICSPVYWPFKLPPRGSDKLGNRTFRNLDKRETIFANP